MTDERLFERLAAHAGPADIDPGFEDRLFTVLQAEMRRPGQPLRATIVLPLAMAAVVLVTTLIGIGVLTRAGVGDSHLPSATSSAGPTPRPLPEAPASSSTGGPIAAGMYRLYGPASGRMPPGWPDTVIVTVPDGWSLSSPNRGVYLQQGAGNIGLDNAAIGGTAEVTMGVAATVIADPCGSPGGTISPPVGLSVDDLATALRSQPTIEFSEPQASSLNGWHGERLELTHPDDCGTAMLLDRPPGVG